MNFRRSAIACLVLGLSSTQTGCGAGDGVGGAGGHSGHSDGGGSGTRSGGSGGAGGNVASGGMGAGAGGVNGGGGINGTGGAVAGMGGGTGGAGAGGSGAGTGGAGSGGSGVDGGSFPEVGGGTDAMGDPKFSFFVISMKALVTLSGRPDGFGGDLRFGQASGLAGADELCRRAAEMGSRGAGQKTWRALLSALNGPGGMPVHARDRIGPGPWFDVNGRMVAPDLASLFGGDRPPAAAQVANDLPNERGEPNHYVGLQGYQPGRAVDNHDTLTGSDAMGRLRAASPGETCNDWTSVEVTGQPWIGHSWPRSATSGRHWASDHRTRGCARGFDRTLGGTGNGPCVGCSGGYGGFYCFALP